jgi:aquaporin Z
MQKYLAEFLGTLFFVYVILATNNPLAIGLTLTLVIFLLQKISGGHVNPAVTIAMISDFYAFSYNHGKEHMNFSL